MGREVRLRKDGKYFREKGAILPLNNIDMMDIQ